VRRGGGRRSDEAEEICAEGRELRQEFLRFALGGWKKIARIPEFHGVGGEFFEKSRVGFKRLLRCSFEKVGKVVSFLERPAFFHEQSLEKFFRALLYVEG